MPITVNISLSTGGRFKPVANRSFAEAHITIGRDKECSLTLEDTQKHVSRVHAELDDKDGRYWLTVVSKVNPVIVNGKRYMFGNRVELADGDVLAVGLYKLELAIPTPAAEPEPPAVVAAPPAPEPPAALRHAFPDDLSADMTYVPPAAPRAALPADDIDDEATYVPPSRTAPAPAPAIEPPPSAGMPAPDEEITFVRPAADSAGPAVGASPPGPPHSQDEEEFSDEVTYIRRPAPRPPEAQVPQPVANATDSEKDFSEDLTYVRRPGASLAEPPAPAIANATRQEAAEPVPHAGDTGDEMDLELDFDLSEGADVSEDETQYRPATPGSPGAGAESAPPEEDDTLLRPIVSGSAPPSAHAALPARDGEQDRSLQAFLDGAGLANLEVEDPQSFMRDSGMMVRTAIEGIMMLLLASSGVKKSFGAQAEEASGNNPLRGMTDPARVIRFLFDPAQRSTDGPDPVQALGDACSELRVHQVALIAAMQAAVLSALQAADPKTIEREQGSHLGGLNLTRKSKLWDLSVAQHEKLTLEVRENLSRILGPEVLAAYLAEVRRVRGGR